MKVDMERLVEIPEGVSVVVTGNEVSVSKNGKTIKKTFDLGNVLVSVKDKNVSIAAKKSTKRELKMIGTINAHVKNMIKGSGKDFVYELEICNVHFPMQVKVDGQSLRIKSFLGEKVDRIAKILPNVKVNVNGNKVEVTSSDVEAAGQTAANIERATKVKNRDRRIFQDGIFITHKPKRKI
jgi:large subunit ribosomal protein L6